MKKKLCLMLGTILALGMLASCGKEDDASVADIPLSELKVEEYVTLGDYKNLSVEFPEIVVEDAEVQNLISSVAQSAMTEEFGVKDKAVEVGETVNIDYVGKKDGVAFDGGSTVPGAGGTLLTIGSGQYIDGFEDGLVGIMPGETVDLNLTFPEAYHNADLAGAEVVFTVTVNYILPKELPDEVVPAIGIQGVSTYAELEAYVREYLEEYKAQENSMEVENILLEAITANSTFAEIPEELIEKYRATFTKNLEAQASQYGMDADTYVQSAMGMSLEEFLDEHAIEALKQNLVFQAIANKEGLNPTAEEIEADLQEAATSMGIETVDEFLGTATREEYAEYFMYTNVMDYLKDLYK